MDPHLAQPTDPLHPSVSRILRQIVEAVHRPGRWAGLCGEMATISENVPIPMDLGLDQPSVAMSSVSTLKAIECRTNLAPARNLASGSLSLSSGDEVRQLTCQRMGPAFAI